MFFPAGPAEGPCPLRPGRRRYSTARPYPVPVSRTPWPEVPRYPLCWLSSVPGESPTVKTRWSRPVRLVGWAMAVVVAQVAVWFLVRSQGNVISGDSPHYLIAAQSLSHLTVNVLPAYTRDMATHAILAWPPGTTVTTPFAIHAYLPGPHGPVFAQGIGLPAVLAPFMALGSVPLALIGLFAVDAAGMVLLHQRASRLAGLGRRGRVVFGLVLAAPALWLAATQVYPDLISGILLACGFVELALVERTGQLDRVGTAVMAVSFGAVPWFHIKNAVPVVIGVVGLVVLGLRGGVSRTRLATTVVVVLASGVALVAYNEFYFAHLLGLPQPHPVVGTGTAWRVVGLLVDRDQGLFIQVPATLLGVVGLWLARKDNRVAVVAVVLAGLSVLAINGSYPYPPLGGASFAGRFQWTLVPLVLAWSPELLARIEPLRPRLVALGTAVVILSVVQAVPIAAGDHVYSNEWFEPFRPWDPTLYPGWWPGLDRILPTFAYPSVHAAEAVVRLALVVVALAAALWLLARLCRPRPFRPRATALVAAGTVAAVAGLVVAGPFDGLPLGAVSWSGADLGSPWAPGTADRTLPPLRLLDLGAGRYRAVFTYGRSGPSSVPPSVTLVTTPSHRDVVSGWLEWRHPTDAASMTVVPAPVDPARGTATSAGLTDRAGAGGSATLTFSLTGPSTLSFALSLPAHSGLRSSGLRLTKVSG